MGVWDGCVMASEALLLGVVSGGRGVLTKPYKGYRARGGWGLARPGPGWGVAGGGTGCARSQGPCDVGPVWGRPAGWAWASLGCW